MKKSKLKNYIRENIISTLSEDTDVEIEKTKELTAAVKDLDAAKKEAGIEEANVGLADLQDIGYDDGEYAVSMHFNQDVIDINNELDYKYYRRGFLQGVKDSTASYKLEENATPKGEDFTYDYEDIGQFYLEGFGKEHTLTQDQLEKLGKKITDKLYGGDIGKAYDAVYKSSQNAAVKRLANRGKLINPITEDEDDDLDAKAIKQAKGARGKHKKLDIALKSLKSITAEMKSLAREYSKADGVEKEKIKDKLKKKTPIKKELEAMVAKLEKNVV
jgi:hypothetical protein